MSKLLGEYGVPEGTKCEKCGDSGEDKHVMLFGDPNNYEAPEVYQCLNCSQEREVGISFTVYENISIPGWVCDRGEDFIKEYILNYIEDYNSLEVMEFESRN